MATEPREQDAIDNPIERLELLAGDDTAVAAYLDEIDVRSPREREMLAELARTTPLADSEGFPAAHHRAIAALESLGRHGYHGSRSGAKLGPARVVVRFPVQLVAHFVVVAYHHTGRLTRASAVDHNVTATIPNAKPITVKSRSQA